MVNKMIKTNDLKKGTRIQLANGWFGTIQDNLKGNTRMCEIEGDFRESGSVYSHDIVRAMVDGSWELVEHTKPQLKLKQQVEMMF